ncbi:hypothetical protein [Bacillus cereus]|nr:hypothetical protein [Bacillus cereus]
MFLEWAVSTITNMMCKKGIVHISITSSLKAYILIYYLGTVGISVEEISVYVDVCTFLKIDSKVVD